MRRYVLYAAAIAAVAVPATATPSGKALHWPTGRPLRVLFVGDSITYGRLATSPAQDFVSLVTTGLDQHGPVSRKVEAVSGVTVGYFKNRVFPAAQDLEIVELGTNIRAEPVPGFAADYKKLMVSVRRRSPHALVICLSPWRPDRTVAMIAPYTDAVRSQCDGTFVNINGLAHHPALIGADHFHPNNAGHAAIAKVVLAAIKP